MHEMYAKDTKYHMTVLDYVKIKSWCNFCEFSTPSKSDYFQWGNISLKCWHEISRGGKFQDNTPISLKKLYGFYFGAGEFIAKKAISPKTENHCEMDLTISS